MQSSEKQSFLTKRNLLIVAALLLAALGLILYGSLSQSGKVAAGTVRIIVNNQLYAEEPLGRERDVVIDQPDGRRNVVHITENGFYMKESTCKNHDCIGQGTVTTDNYSRRALQNQVICLPNQVILELALTDQTPDPSLPDM